MRVTGQLAVNAARRGSIRRNANERSTTNGCVPKPMEASNDRLGCGAHCARTGNHRREHRLPHRQFAGGAHPPSCPGATDATGFRPALRSWHVRAGDRPRLLDCVVREMEKLALVIGGIFLGVSSIFCFVVLGTLM